MITQNQKEDILFAVDIVELIDGKGVKLKKAGGHNYKGICPFHDEKDESFSVDSLRKRYHCFGCGKSGDAISFLMELENKTFIESCRELASKCSIQLKEYTPTEQDEQEQKEKRKMLTMYKIAKDFFCQELPKAKEAEEYARSRFSADILQKFEIGFAPDNFTSLSEHFIKLGYKEEEMYITGLVKKDKNGKAYDMFRGRLMFPVCNVTGEVIAFSGRTLKDKDDKGNKIPKYINSSESILYVKGNVLFGINHAFNAIKKKDIAILVEGNADVVKMHEIGIYNVIAACGTALTDEQIRIIGRLTKNFCLMLDSDNAGQKAREKSGKKIIEAGFNAYVLNIPNTETGGKQDPDSFFHSVEQFEDFEKTNKQSFLQKLADDNKEKCKDALEKVAFVKDMVSIFYKRNKSEVSALINTLSQIIPTKTTWKEAYKELTDEDTKEQSSSVNGKSSRTQEQNLLIERYGFYIANNSYYFYSLKGDNFFQGSNFVMEPLFHIESVLNAKRLYRITNLYGVSKVLELNQKDLISIAAFKLRVESLGNFLFDGGEFGLGKIKSYLYENTKTCKEITQLGWQKQGFFAWANGISTSEKFIEINELGIVEYEKNFYYLPAFSSFYQEEESFFQFERKFINKESNVSFYDFADLFYKVYGDNAMFAIAFYVATLFRDVIVNAFRFFPLLNIFGIKGTGKSEMAVTMLKLFGDLPVGINITNSTIPATADHVAKTRNALCHIDEYKNSIEDDKVEFLKGLWDGVGRSRMNMDKDKKKEMTAVDAGIILTGQEMATANNALFSRIIFLTFNKVEFTDEENKLFDQLKELEKKGLTQITNRLLKYRKLFIEKFVKNYEVAKREIQNLLGQRIEERVLKNWIIIVAALRTIKDNEALPFSYEKVVRTATKFIIRQNCDVIASNEVIDFWNTYQTLFSNGTIENEFDFHIQAVEKVSGLNVAAGTKVIFVNPNRIFTLYAQEKRSTNDKKLPKETLQYYLKNSDEFIGITQKRFRRNIKNLQEKETAKVFVGDGSEPAVEYERPLAWCFDYEKLAAKTGMNITTEFIYHQKNSIRPITNEEVI